jgi:gamma-glutamyltranspeptidase/glutathione hydrolase
MGATTLLMLKLLQEEKGDGRDAKPNSAERIRRTVAAARIAYAARDAQLGDPRFMKGGFSLEEFLRVGIGGAQRKRRINDGDTTYFAVADGEGNVLSCIQSLFYGLGSRVYVEKCGFFLNNRGSSFRLGGRGPNVLEPRKRPLHTLSSLILTKGDRPFVAVGASGGDYRPQQHALFVTNIVDYSMNVEEAIDYPRFLWDGGETVKVEAGYEGLDRLKMKKVALGYPGQTGVAQGVQRMAECLSGVCDVRGEGLPVGY